jgi:hypothetical protein
MDNPYFNIISFLISTLLYYYFFKPTLTYTQLINESEYNQYLSNSYLYLGIYFGFTLFVQFLVNISLIASKCGGNIGENMGASAFLTFIPWILIFGVLMIILIIYPGFKSAFSDVVGYFYVSNEANRVLSELLVEPDVQKSIEMDKNMTPEQKTDMESAADLIVKIVGNKSLLINQIVPENFAMYWKTLTPLMKPQYQTEGNDMINKRDELLSIVLSRDNIGEAVWYIYTGILLISIVQMKIASRTCNSNPNTMQRNYEKYVEEEKEKKAEQKITTKQVYTIE